MDNFGKKLPFFDQNFGDSLKILLKNLDKSQIGSIFLGGFEHVLRGFFLSWAWRCDFPFLQGTKLVTKLREGRAWNHATTEGRILEIMRLQE